MSHPLLTLLQRPRLQVLGLMSGTSVDGLDCALVDIARGEDGAPQVLGVRARTYEYSADERARVHHLFTPAATVRDLCEGSFWLAERHAARALEFLATLGVSPTQVDLIGSHGQTVWHQPPSACRGPGSTSSTPSTLQIGEPAVLAARTGIVTIADFRVADVALGGEGAPLVPYCDWLLFRRPGRLRALQNLGGIANVTLVGDALAQVLAFDNGPGNMMIDALAERVPTGGAAQAMDRDGLLSAGGVVQEDILALLLDDDYLRQAPPKSTGRERYGRAATQALAERFAARRPQDLLRTAVEFTARAVAESLRGRGVDEVLLSGGGAHNPTLRGRIAALLAPVPVQTFAEGDIDADNKEAVAFAVLAVEALHARPANVPQVTGARGSAILGKLCLPPPRQG